MLMFSLGLLSGVTLSTIGFWWFLHSRADAHLAPGAQNDRYD